ncbi:hypothetical protein SARC_12371 [Sphaeroforma arctica JP610]|uniref:Uncharacterized protein n=1 Tax=Sphaeroforma arctica JP610 TaxID=667725 RepID=A0A0L0FEB6_9EUKA|nr:hypothetical protein SARC_12371 [Sphaeroforma arctica JP610]KNC75097.1 hypothetical protein SARC_12371 [Sphaeroforma arctica JP610]|eukprot:XP_014148999.1 hypothetical protein SARC_12371 [Sphaeroforma arctica JP610]
MLEYEKRYKNTAREPINLQLLKASRCLWVGLTRGKDYQVQVKAGAEKYQSNTAKTKTLPTLWCSVDPSPHAFSKYPNNEESNRQKATARVAQQSQPIHHIDQLTITNGNKVQEWMKKFDRLGERKLTC